MYWLKIALCLWLYGAFMLMLGSAVGRMLKRAK
jgi:hypothetical protein